MPEKQVIQSVYELTKYTQHLDLTGRCGMFTANILDKWSRVTVL